MDLKKKLIGSYLNLFSIGYRIGLLYISVYLSNAKNDGFCLTSFNIGQMLNSLQKWKKSERGVRDFREIVCLFHKAFSMKIQTKIEQLIHLEWSRLTSLCSSPLTKCAGVQI